MGYRATSGDCVLCPFWIAYGDPRSDARSIICEGDIPDSRCKTIFKGMTQRDFHAKTYCENHYKRCEHYISIIHHRWQDDD